MENSNQKSDRCSDRLPSNLICGGGRFVNAGCCIVIGGANRFQGDLCINIYSTDPKMEEAVTKLLDKLGFTVTDKEN